MKKRWKLETSHEALMRKIELRRDLKRNGVRIRKCKRGNRCKCEHCHPCLRIYRQNLVREAKRLHLARKKKGWLALTLTPDTPPIPVGKLDTYNISSEVAKHRRRLTRHLPDVLIIGGIDIALKYEGKEVVGWQPHLHLMIYGIHQKASLKALRAAYPKSEHAPKPIRHEKIKGSFNGALSYTYKSVFFPRGNPKMIPRNGKRAALPRQYELELRAYLAHWPIGSRTILRYAKFSGPRTNIRRRLVLIPPYDTEFG